MSGVLCIHCFMQFLCETVNVNNVGTFPSVVRVFYYFQTPSEAQREAEYVQHLASGVWVEEERREISESYCKVRSVFFFFFLALMQLFAILLLLRETSLNVSLLER